MDTKIIHTANETCGTSTITLSTASQAQALIATIAAQFPRIEPAPITTEAARLDALAAEWVNRISPHARGWGMAEWLADHQAAGITAKVFKTHLKNAYQRGIIGKEGRFYCAKE